MSAIDRIASIERIIFLGTSSALPTNDRNTSSIAIILSTGNTILLDCGESTQHSIIRNNYPGLSLSRIDIILLTHLHGDHCYGIFGLLATMGMSRVLPITIVAPKGVKELIVTVLQLTATYLPYELNFIELDSNEPVNLGILISDITIHAVPLTHRVPAYGFVIEESPKVGALDVIKANKSGCKGPQLRDLKSGKDVVLSDGSVVYSKDCVGLPEPGGKVVLLQDTSNSDLALPYCDNLHVLIHEATYDSCFTEKAIEHGHSTARMAAEFISRLNNPPNVLALTHVSARYRTNKNDDEKVKNDDHVQNANILVDEARNHLESVGNIKTNCILAFDGLILERKNKFLQSR